MKKHLPILALILFCATAAFAQGAERNLQKIYPVDSDVYKALTLLYVDQGMALPSTTGPWSGDELLGMAEKIDRTKLASGAAAAYDFVLSALDEGHKPFKFDVSVAVEGYYHTDTANFKNEGQWIRGFDERSPFLDIVLETWPAKNFYGYSSLGVQNSRYNGETAADGPTSTLWGSSALTTNLPLVPPAVITDLDFNIPYRAFGSVGGKGWNLQVGRDKLSWGPGESGNFVIGDHLLYHNVGKLAAYGKNFKYSFTTSFFPHPQNYYYPDDLPGTPAIENGIIDTTGAFLNYGSQDAVLKGLNMFIGHRLEWRMFKDKVGFALTEAIMYQSADNTLDLFILSPAAIFHNYYIRSNANSIISLELDYSPIKGINLYGQMAVDEFPLPGEPVPGVKPDALPNGFAFMAGAKLAKPMGKGIAFGSVEWAKTDPYLYLRDSGDRDQDLGEYGINWIVAEREFATDANVTYTEQFLGYQYGGDAIVYNVNGGYKVFGKWSAEANFFYMLHGTHDKWTVWGDQDDPVPDTQTTPTSTHVTENNGDLGYASRNAVSKTLVVGARGSYSILKNLKAYGQLDYINIVNPGNISANPAISDIQLTAGIKYTF